MKNYISTGNQITITAGATVASGEVVLVGTRIGVAVKGGASGEAIALNLEGVYELAKTSADVIAVGALVYWNNTAKEITTTSAGNTLAGFAMAAAGAGVTKVQVKINS